MRVIRNAECPRNPLPERNTTMSRRAIVDYSTKELQNLIQNHRDRGKVEEPAYVEALEELGRRKGQGLDFGKSFKLIREYAENRKFLPYKQLAVESGLEWEKVRYAVNGHLGDLIEYSHRRGWPLLSAIVVNQEHSETGDMKPTALQGFVTAARSLGYEFSDDSAFLKEQQKRVFEWASTPDTTASQS
jgi:hypothetical protein